MVESVTQQTPTKFPRIVPTRTILAFEFPDLASWEQEVSRHLASEPEGAKKNQLISWALQDLAQVRTDGLEKLRQLENDGKPPFDPDPFWETIGQVDRLRAWLLTECTEVPLPPRASPPQPGPSASQPDLPKRDFGPILDLEDMVSYLKMSKSYVYHALPKGEITGAYKVGSKWFITLVDIEALVLNNKKQHTNHASAS
jgi:hypothetical protein